MAYDSAQQPTVRCPLCGGPVDVRVGRCAGCGWAPGAAAQQTGSHPPILPAYQQGQLAPGAQGYHAQAPYSQTQRPLQTPYQQPQSAPQQYQQPRPAQGQTPGAPYGQQPAPAQQSYQQPAAPHQTYQQTYQQYMAEQAHAQEAAPAPASMSKPKTSIVGIIAAVLSVAVVVFACLPWVQMSDTLTNLAAFSGMEVDPSLELDDEYPIWGLLSLNGTLEAYSGIVGFYAGDNDTIGQLQTLKVVVFIDVVVWGICVVAVLFFAVRTVIGRGRKAGGLSTACFALALYALACMIVMPMVGDIIAGTTANVVICLILSLVCGTLATIASRKRKS